MGKAAAKGHRRVISSPREFSQLVQQDRRERTRAYGPRWTAKLELKPEMEELGESLEER